MKSFNIKFPLTDNSETNSLFSMSKTSKEVYKSNLLLLLLTDKGERYYEPDYGTNLNKFIFEPNDSITQNDIVNDIKQTVSKFIPSITVDEVKFYWKEDSDVLIDNNQLELTIKFTYSEEFFTEQSEILINF